LVTFQSHCSAQASRGNDTTYYIFFPESITSRVYLSQKHTSFHIKSKEAKDIDYFPNTNLNIGVGATWHNISLNLAFGFGFLNNDDDKGKTKYIDLQAHLYKPKWVTDFYGQFYEGYHLNPRGFAAKPDENYYSRPDIKVTLIGIAQYYIFNPTRFSYRASFIQNEWQKKSAGTFLLGAEAYYGVLNGDSALVPKSIENQYAQKNVHRVDYLSLGPGAGYAYTLVIAHHVFLTGSVTGNLNLSYATESDFVTHKDNFSLNFVPGIKAAAGYNSRSWIISANFTGNNMPFKGATAENKYAIQTGNYRFIISKRFMTGKKIQKTLNPLNSFLKE
jgi:hypothetical protein